MDVWHQIIALNKSALNNTSKEDPLTSHGTIGGMCYGIFRLEFGYSGSEIKRTVRCL